MRFRFQVGNSGEHEVEYSFNQLRGQLVISLNGQEVFRRMRPINEPVCEKHLIRVDENGRLDVLVEKQRRQLFGHRYRVFINGRLYKSYAELWNPLHTLARPFLRKRAKVAPAR